MGGAAGGTASGGRGGASGGAVPLDPALLSRCAGTNPIRCAIPVAANGNYTVTVELGSAAAVSASRVQAELFRIVVPPVALAAGEFSRRTFAVNVRAETHDGYSAPGMILDLVIDGDAPALHGLGFAAAPSSMPTIFVAGDSTVCDWDPLASNIIDPIQRGWAQEFSQFLDAGIAVANYADSGETAGTFYSKFFTPAKNLMRAGDVLFIQFGHNDQKDTVAATAYQANLMKYISDARAKDATPILLTPVGRKSSTATNPGFDGLDQQARDLAASQNVTLLDLTMLTIEHYRTVSNLGALFATPTEGTHFSETGATQVAQLVARALKAGTSPVRSHVLE
jgi:lysophospholipase L1-like esterase